MTPQHFCIVVTLEALRTSEWHVIPLPQINLSNCNVMLCKMDNFKVSYGAQANTKVLYTVIK